MIKLGRIELWDQEALGPRPGEPGIKLKAFIGSGGLSIVYLSSLAGRKTAVKASLHLRPWRTLERAEQEGLLKEAKLLAKLRHPNILAVLAYGTSSWP